MAVSSVSHPSEPAPNEVGLPAVPWDRVERFVGQLAHDIRNGLNALELQLTFLGEISTDPEAVDEIKRVRATVSNITRHLQVLRTATGTIKPYPLEYPAKEFFDDLRERFIKLHPDGANRVAWETEIEGESMLEVDPELALNALLELLTNALAFGSSEPATIRAVVTANTGGTTFLLHEPQASPPEVMPRDWGRTPLLTTRRGAYGLGLFRVRRSLEAQGGGFEVEYMEEKRLLLTRVTLPAAAQK